MSLEAMDAGRYGLGAVMIVAVLVGVCGDELRVCAVYGIVEQRDRKYVMTRVRARSP